MAKLTLPGGSNPLQNEGISITSAGEAMKAATKSGDIAQQLGRSLMQEGQSYFDKAQSAIDDAVVNDRYSNATKEFSTRAQERMSKAYNEDGSPNFLTLSSDIQNIGNEVQSKYSSGLTSADTLNKFNQSFGDVVNRQTISSGSYSRQQLQDYSKAQLMKRMDTNYQMALTDPTNLDGYVADTQSAIQSAVASGALDASDAERMRQQANSHIRMGALQVLNDTNPQALNNILQQNEAVLGINAEEKVQLSKLNATKLQDIEYQNKLQQNEKLNAVKIQQQFNQEQTEIQLQGGQIGQSDLDKKLSNGEINHSQYTALTLKLMSAKGETLKNTAIFSAISGAVTNHEPLAGQFSDSEINDFYKQKVVLGKDQKGNLPNLLQKAPMVASIQAPVTAYTDELKAITLGNDTKKFLEAAQSYDFVKSKNELAVSKLDSKTQAALVVTNMLVRNAGKNIDPATIVAHVKDTILNVDESKVNLREKEFNSIREFKGSTGALYNDGTLDKTIKEVYNTTYSNEEVPQKLKDETASMLKQAYLLTGDKDAAIAFTKDAMSKKYGPSDINSTPAIGRDPKTVTMYPPEKVFGQQATAQELRADLNNEIGTLIQQRNLGIDPNAVYVKGDVATDIAMNGKQTPTYGLFYKDSNGIETPLTDEQGTMLRWSPDLGQISAKRQEASMAKATGELGAQLQRQGYLERLGMTAADVKGFSSDGSVHLQKAKPDGQTVNLFMDPKTGKLVSGNTRNFGTSGEYPNMFQQSTLPSNPHPQLQETAYAILGVENGGASPKYNQQTPTGDGRTALGAYQILDVYVSAWSKEALGRSVTKSEFLRNPAIQDKIALHKINQYVTKTGSPEEAMSMWFTGGSIERARAKGVKDKFGTTIDDYLTKGNKYRNLYNSQADKGVGRAVKEASAGNATPFTVAGSYLGTSESKHKDVLGSVFKKVLGKNIDPQQVPWCAAFVSSVLKETGHESSKGQLSAREYLNVGQAVDKPTKGDIVVLTRGSDPSKGHVGFYAGEKNGKVLVLGGNQNDSVSIKEYSLSAVLGYRRPTRLSLNDGPSSLRTPPSDLPKTAPAPQYPNPNGGTIV